MHTVAIGSDPNAIEAKKNMIRFLSQKGYSVTDMGSDDAIYANVAIQVSSATFSRVAPKGRRAPGFGYL